MTKRLAAILAAVLFLCRCSSPAPAPSPLPLDTSGTPTNVGEPVVLVGAGDIASCDSPGSAATARLLDTIDGTIFTAGDNAYPSGSAADYRNCYGPTWGRHRDRTRPSPGNHEYLTANAAPYFEYFGANAGPAGLGYYSYAAGAWHVVSLNSEIDMRPGSPQDQWLRRDLAMNRSRCTMAYFHRPRFSSGPHGGSADVRDLWRALYDYQVDVVVSGHDHLYERFAAQDPDGRVDAARGIRQFVAGTGGGERFETIGAQPNSEVRGQDWGVLALTLTSDGYRWEFVPVAGASFHDSGSGVCH